MASTSEITATCYIRRTLMEGLEGIGGVKGETTVIGGGLWRGKSNTILLCPFLNIALLYFQNSRVMGNNVVSRVSSGYHSVNGNGNVNGPDTNGITAALPVNVPPTPPS
jgi:hypothetical protein